ncbi:MAG: DUF2007 domain-containing protein [Saprospiraceae bacterium]|nr:MAG: hypothetical protein UZ09_BCD002000823 [Bacteroidetes bacterium OLB9]MCO6464498.1 DUF2007 domain-containing protein [Saprospiraceae bacterium]
MDVENFVTIRSYKDRVQGEVMLAALHNAGIKTFLRDDGNNVLPFENELVIMVHESDVDAALELLEKEEDL